MSLISCSAQAALIRKFRESGGLGISLEGTVDMVDKQETRSHHYIRAILPDGAVGVEGSLRSGDEILEVNGHELIMMNHADVVSLLKELPLSVLMVCARPQQPSVKVCANNNVANVSNRNKDGSDGRLAWEADKTKDRANGPMPSLLDRMVKAKSDGSLAIGVVSPAPVLTLTDDASRIRSRSLEPLTGLAMWSSEPLLIHLTKTERGLGFSILDYQVTCAAAHAFVSRLTDASLQDPMNLNETVIVVRSLVPGGVAQLDGRIIPGDRLISVNGINLENATLDQAVDALKGAARGVVEIQVAKPLPLPDFETSGLRLLVS